eukprot:2058198-Pleurochrysis_carterae.AAC.1
MSTTHTPHGAATLPQQSGEASHALATVDLGQTCEKESDTCSSASSESARSRARISSSALFFESACDALRPQ